MVTRSVDYSHAPGYAMGMSDERGGSTMRLMAMVAALLVPLIALAAYMMRDHGTALPAEGTVPAFPAPAPGPVPGVQTYAERGAPQRPVAQQDSLQMLRGNGEYMGTAAGAAPQTQNQPEAKPEAKAAATGKPTTAGAAAKAAATKKLGRRKLKPLGNMTEPNFNR